MHLLQRRKMLLHSFLLSSGNTGIWRKEFEKLSKTCLHLFPFIYLAIHLTNGRFCGRETETTAIADLKFLPYRSTNKSIWIITCSVAQSCPTLWDIMGCSPPGSSVHGISQARTRSGLPFSLPVNNNNSRQKFDCWHNVMVSLNTFTVKLFAKYHQSIPLK